MRSMRWLLSMGLGLGLVGTVGAQVRQGAAQAELTGSVMGKVACDDANVPARFARVTLDPVPLAADATKAQATGLGAGLGADVGSGVISGSAGVTVTTVTTTVETALDGSFSMPKVKAGEYYVNIEKEGYITAKSMFTAKEIANPTPEVKAILDKVLHRIKVEVGQTTQVEVRLERGAALGGTVLYDDGSPAGEMQLKLLHKDVSLACQLGREVSVPMRLTNLAHQELTEAMNRGWGARDSRVGALLQQERAGIPPIAVDPAKIKAVMDADEK